MLTVQNLSKRFGKKQVLNDISFNAKKGEVTALRKSNSLSIWIRGNTNSYDYASKKVKKFIASL